jgi:serine/threonine-protein kinase RsbT
MTEHRSPLPGDVISIRDESDVAMARQRVRAFGLQQAMSETRIAALATAVTEIARNILVYAGSGEMSFAAASSTQRRGIVVIARDWGPGIEDIAQAMEDGYSTGSGLGMGLAGAQRLVDEFEIESAAGIGVKVMLTQWSDDEP